MLDKRLRPVVDSVTEGIAARLVQAGISANSVTWSGFAIGLVSALAIASSWFILGAFLLLLSRLCDALDGAVARRTVKSDLGGFLDIVLDFAFYGLVPFAFIVADPVANALPGALILLVFYINGASFLTFALMSQKRGLDESQLGTKSLYYSAGLAEATETIAFFVLCCLFPAWFGVLAYFFALLVLITTCSRFVLAYRNFGK